MRDKILEAIITGVAAAFTWAICVWVYTFLRNLWVEREIRKSFSKASVGTGIYGYSVHLFNRTKYEVRVREVRLFTNAGTDLLLLATGAVAYDSKIDLKELASGHGTMAFGNKEAILGLPVAGHDQMAPVPLAVESSANWLLPNRACLDEKIRPDGGCCVVDFETLFGPRRALRILFDSSSSKSLATEFDQHREQCLNNPFMKQFLR